MTFYFLVAIVVFILFSVARKSLALIPVLASLLLALLWPATILFLFLSWKRL